MGGVPTEQNDSSALALSVSQQKKGSAVPAAPVPESKPKKICCACPNTKKLRDGCMLEHGEEAACSKWIEAHRKCLRTEGFNV